MKFWPVPSCYYSNLYVPTRREEQPVHMFLLSAAQFPFGF